MDELRRIVSLPNGLDMSVVDTGKGDRTLLLVPGWTMASDVFIHQVAHFARRDGWRVIAIDPRGTGRSSKDVDGFHIDQRADDLALLFETLNLTKVVLVGWSLGVQDQLAYVARHGPLRLSGLVMVDGTPHAYGLPDAPAWGWFAPGDTDGEREGTTLSVLRDRHPYNRIFGQWMLAYPTEETLDWIDAVSSMTPDTIAAVTNETMAYGDYSGALSSLTLPALMIAREDWQEVVPPWLTKNAPEVEFEAFGKHMMFFDQAERFNARVAAFLDKIEAKTAQGAVG